ncbi:MAG: hypothetical protein P3B98_06185 [Gemmatimonadota bacterium]|nr:hypothetical protein [Gemmatimonadota bacterium]
MQRVIVAALFAALSAPLAAQYAAATPAETPKALVAGGSLHYGAPQGDFANNVNAVFGVGGYVGMRLGSSPFVLRGDLAYSIYGSETLRTPLGSGPLGLIRVDVNTTNNILTGGLGLQMGHPGRSVNPYVGGSVGFSYFFTESSVSGSSQSSSEVFASSTNMDDGTFAKTLFGGLYIPVGSSGAAMDVGVKYHWNGEALYLTERDITFDSSGNPVLSPRRSRADLLTIQVGVSFGRR